MNDEEIKINPIPGSLVIWPSNFLFPHKVNPLKFGKRFTVVAWG
jgi:predicted 2-oxoglutarate/Fe(II)-dependent dioxygenase YbiX